ncbi:hypothetical protein MTO98_10070 [Mucilaginibacter sp. SMC90]|uniref:hypothetical protein n=1 Tax=Mucilaginibacter sp. SMC90 TaxID=2929803 RepID=UPI001FB2DB4C|nr:hypothetical protein [Mucilaginibacter sp. SMC90]UOE51422.1 hypothetical protein MTO98_10070 [Mucilaginibacter sp. SMC90]
MEKLTILRMFFCFPLVGLLVPDAGILLSNYPGTIPTVHIFIEIALLVCIALCTAAIAYGKKRNQDQTNETSFS